MKDEMKGEGAPKMMPISDNRLTVGELTSVLRRTDHYWDSVLLDLTGGDGEVVPMRRWARMDHDGEDCLGLAWRSRIDNAHTVEDLMGAIYWGKMERWFTNDTRVIIFESNEGLSGPSTCTHIATGVVDKGARGVVIECEGVPKMMPISDNRLTVGELISVLRRTDHYWDSVLLDLTGIGKGFVEMRNWTRMDRGEDKACLALAWQGGGKVCTVEDLMRVIYWGEIENWFTNDTRVVILDSETNTYLATGVEDNGANGMVITCDGTQGDRREGGKI